MCRPARIAVILLFAVFTTAPGRADIIVNWLDSPIDVSTDTTPVSHALDINGDGVFNFTFSADTSFVGVRSEGDNRYLIFPSPPPNIGGSIEPLSEGFEIGPNSDSGELEWFGHETSFAALARIIHE